VTKLACGSAFTAIDLTVKDDSGSYSFGNQNQEIAGRILQKMAPMIVKYANDNGFGMIIDTSKPWPQGPVLLAGDGLDITKAVVDAYNVQSGVPAPPAAGASTTTPKTAPKPASAKPATPKPTEPPK